MPAPKRAGVDWVEWHVLPDPVMQANALRRGEVDILAAPALGLLPQSRNEPDLEVKRFDRLGWMAYIRPNHLYKPFNDVRARQALAYLVDQSDIMAAGAGDHANWDICWSFLACDPAMPRPAAMAGHGTPDLPRARQRMADAGYAGEPIVVLDPVDDPTMSNIAAVTISQLRRIGVTVQVLAMDTAALIAMRASKEPPDAGGWHLFHGLSLGLELEDPLTNFPLASPCDGEGAPSGWFGWPCDGAIETLRQQWADAPDETERSRIAGPLQEAAMRSLPFIPLGSIYRPVAYRRAVYGLPEMPVPVLSNAS